MWVRHWMLQLSRLMHGGDAVSDSHHKPAHIASASLVFASRIACDIPASSVTCPVTWRTAIARCAAEARFPFKRNRLRCVRCVNENRKKRKRLRFSRNKRKRQPIVMLGRSSGNHDWLLANASACVSYGFRLRNARNASDRVWMETGLESSPKRTRYTWFYFWVQVIDAKRWGK